MIYRLLFLSLFLTPVAMAITSFSKKCFLGKEYTAIFSRAKDANEHHSLSDTMPDENRFTQVTIDERMDEPMELAVADNGDVYYIERKGKIKMYVVSKKRLELVGKLNVYAENEDGLLGMALDPGFEKNHRLFLYYSPSGTESINRLSRFTLINHKIDLKSEKILMDIPVVRACCHSGGSVAFGPDGNLYLSLGDDTNPFESNSYNPIDERPGKWDAQKTSGNSNDLRGKILRIHPEPDGSYTIPNGNLFANGSLNARPEIYVMGNRNPFRISIDQHTKFLYWGEVGPDAGADDSSRGPKGYDEINQARAAGFFGWPYFVADNKAYNYYDFTKQKSGPKFLADKPVNNSPNNTGVKNLPPAQKAFIWYPYDDSKEFPLVGKGGRNAMAGPVFYNNDYRNSQVKFPAYYNGKLFIYDWMRNWIMAVAMDEQGRFANMERFMPATTFNKPIDMQFGKDGALYVLEYGTYWNSQNDDSKLSRIEFNEGNRKPVIKISSDNQVGAAPLTVHFSAKKSFDYDKEEQLRFEWSFTKSGVVQATTMEPSFTFTKPGVYTVTAKAIDKTNAASMAALKIEVGNEPPKVSIQTKANRSFYWDNSVVDYRVSVVDKEDGTIGTGIDPGRVRVSFRYVPEGNDIVAVTQGHQLPITTGSPTRGKALMAESDCKACHALNRASVGPSYMAIATKYKNKPTVASRLAAKIIKGGGGVWGNREMSAHPQLSTSEATDIVAYVLSLANNQRQQTGNMPIRGQLVTKEHIAKDVQGSYVLTASYTDRGTSLVKPITRQQILSLRSPMVLAAEADEFADAAKGNNGKSKLVKFTKDGAYIVFRHIDLANVKHVLLSVKPKKTSGKIELHTGSVEGKLIASTPELLQESFGASNNQWNQVSLAITDSVAGEQDLYVLFKGSSETSIWNTFDLNTIYFDNK